MTCKSPAALIAFDGCRPGGQAPASTPHTGTRRQHGVVEDSFHATANAYSSILDAARAAGLHTATFYRCGEVTDRTPPGDLGQTPPAACGGHPALEAFDD